MSALICCVFVCLLHLMAAQTQVCRHYSNYSSSYMHVVDVSINSAAVTGGGLIISSDVDYVSFETTLSGLASPDILIKRTVQMLDSTAEPPLIQLSTVLLHTSTPGSPSLTAVTMEENIAGSLQAYWTASFVPGFVSGVSTIDRDFVEYVVPSPLSPGDNATLQFEAEPSGDQGKDLSPGITDFSVIVSFNESGSSFGPLLLPVCLDTIYEYNTSVIYEHGLTALTFFLAMLVGFLLVVLGVFLFLLICRRRKKASVSPEKYDEMRLKERGKKIVMDPKAALRKGLNVIKDYSIMGWNESIILILGLKDKLHMFREIDNLDVLATIHVDTDLEQEQNEAAVQTSLLLVQGLRHNGDISRQTEDAAVSAFHSQLRDLDKKLEAEYKKDLEVVYTDLSSKNKEKLAELLQKHRQQKQQAIAATKELPDKERQGLLALIEQQQQMEENELTFTLALEQNEGAEQLRKEYAIRKRMGIKENQQNLMSEVINKGQLQTEQADWLLKEHKKQQEAVHRMYDEEISRQRSLLEEKLARRRALAQASETEEDDSKECLNLTAAHIVNFLQKGRKNSLVSAELTEDWIEEMKGKAVNIKTEMDAANDMAEKDLHKKLSETKKSQLAELMKKHNAEIQEYIKKSKAQQTEGPVDPVSLADGMLKLKSQHRVEMTSLENKLDTEHAAELTARRQKEADMAQEKLKELEREAIQRMQTEGMMEKVVATLVKKHEDEMYNLQMTQEKNRRNQEDKLKEKLAQRQREWHNRREKERQEQEDLREHEADVVEKLVNSQVSMSEAERDRIMKEHEKQMVLLENSLTLNKLRQQRALEERLSQRRAQQINKLQDQQKSEVIKQRRVAENNGEEDDAETHHDTLQLMKKHAQQRIAVMQGQQLNIDEELDQIRIEMTRERAVALKGQEERLGAMITSLQMEKAREMTRIEEQQKAINNLKANLMDDLNDRGILSTPECERILDIHKQESAALNNRMETQRNKQEEILRAKLEARVQQREQLMLARQESEMKSLMESQGTKFGAKVKRVMLVHKHMVEMEKFRNRMDREVSQSLAETRRQFDMIKLNKIQEQELSFVAGLVRVGAFQENELLDVLHMLFPGKTEEEIHQLLEDIMQGSPPNSQHNVKKNLEASSIVGRVYQTQFSNASLPKHTGSTKSDRSVKKRLAKKGSRMSLTHTDPDISLAAVNNTNYSLDSRRDSSVGMYDGRRSGPRNSVTGYDNPALSIRSTEYIDPYGRFNKSHRITDDGYNPDYNDGVDFIAMGANMSQEEGRSAPSGRLPPMDDQDHQTSKKKKKKKKGMLKKHRQLQDVDDL